MSLDLTQSEYLHKVIFFPVKNGCIPEKSTCFCMKKSNQYYWVAFREPIFGQYEIKLHEEVIRKHGIVVR